MGRNRYPVEELNRLRRARGPADPVACRAAWTSTVSLPVIVAVGRILPSGTTALLVVLLVAAPAALAAVRMRVRPAAYELWADHRGRAVRLYRTRNRTEFGRVSRALIRAAG